MNVTREEAITYLTELKDNPIKLINEIDSEIEAVTLDLVLSMAIKALEQSPITQQRSEGANNMTYTEQIAEKIERS